MLSMDEPDHKRLRDIVDEAFRRRAVLEMEPLVKVSASFSTWSASACVVVAHTLAMIGNRTSTTEPAVRSFSIAAAGLRKYS
jgi:cytochrome P450